MKFKALMITTIACSAMTQFAMADIILTDSNEAKVTIANDGKCTYATENGFFRAYKGLKSIEIKDISEKNAKGDLTKTFKKFLDGQYNQAHQTETNISIESSDSSIKDIYGYIVNEIYSIKNLTFKNVLIEEFLPSEANSIKFAQNATLTIDDAITTTGKPVSLASFGSENLETLNVNKEEGKATAYLRIGDYTTFTGLKNMTVKGDIYWADDPNADPKKYKNLDLHNNGEHHGGALCTFIVPPSLQFLNIDLSTWNGARTKLGVPYLGYTGIAIDETKADKSLKINIGYLTSALYLINSESTVESKILTKDQISTLSEITVPFGQDCYKVRSESTDFLWIAPSFDVIKVAKTQAGSNLRSLHLMPNKNVDQNDTFIHKGTQGSTEKERKDAIDSFNNKSNTPVNE